ncbi:BamA/TamA family outer membrane protein [Ekhidna lutea]|uniref:BamA/TamA family outer membrane protein n=1 Tax=Ekhidna lutea TaxID=447679 RepID=UPI00117C6F62|nr:BamA/TamA family outer membrane protein [Ekhidna lutea]
MNIHKFTFLLILLLGSFNGLIAQNDSTELLTIGKIIIEGNFKTKPQMITRELSFAEDSTYQRYQLDSMFVWDRNRIYNTNLFNEVNIELANKQNGDTDVKITVDERWYFYPFPIFRLTDRNFNDWWVNRDRDLSRVNYGLKLSQFNFRGRGELLRLWLQTGFETVLNLHYRIPYIDKQQKNGLLISSSYFEAKNVPVTTIDNVRRFTSSRENILRKAFTNSIVHSYRSSFYSYHRTSIGHLRVDIADTVASLNPNYLGDGKTQQQYFSLAYSYVWDRRNNPNYPTKGELYRAGISKVGLGLYNDVDYWRAGISLTKYWSFKDNFFLASNLRGVSTFPAKDRNYFNYTSMGFGREVLRGYDLNIIEASSYVMQRNEFKHQLFGRKYDISKAMPLRQFQTLPITIYAKIFFDQGYAIGFPNYEGSALLTDKYLYSIGTGLDLVIINDITFRFELSKNAENQTHFFINLLSLL